MGQLRVPAIRSRAEWRGLWMGRGTAIVTILLPQLPPAKSIIAPLHSHSSSFHLNLAGGGGKQHCLSLVTFHTYGDISLGLS